MSEIFFTSDHHFGHAKILEYEPIARPFSSIEYMNEALIEKWNSVVRKGDIVYHLGDFAFGSQNIKIAARLAGSKRLIMGNHDSYDYSAYTPYFEKLHGVKCYHECVLTHIPVHPKNLGSRYFLNVHGHSHSKKVMLDGREDLNYFNCCVEVNDLMPVHYDLIRERIKLIHENF